MEDCDNERIYEEVLLEEAKTEFLKSSPILKFFDAVCFVSRSRGRGKKRKNYHYVVLLKSKHINEWISLNEKGFLNGKKYLFDTWAAEIFGESFCANLNENPDEYLRRELLNLLEKLKRF